MSEIVVTPMEPGTFGVQVTEGTVTTSHRVTVPEDLLDDLAVPADDGERLVRESFAFLLEREPATSVLSDFPLTAIERYFPEYRDEISRRLTG